MVHITRQQPLSINDLETHLLPRGGGYLTVASTGTGPTLQFQVQTIYSMMYPWSAKANAG